jgi:hypothetical protein
MMTLNMEAALSSVTSVNFYQNTRRHTPEDNIRQVFYRLGVLGLRFQGPIRRHILCTGYSYKAEY